MRCCCHFCPFFLTHVTSCRRTLTMSPPNGDKLDHSTLTERGRPSQDLRKRRYCSAESLIYSQRMIDGWKSPVVTCRPLRGSGYRNKLSSIREIKSSKINGGPSPFVLHFVTDASVIIEVFHCSHEVSESHLFV
jgi:hypothetical protein